MEKFIEKLYKTIIKDGIDEYKDLLENTNLEDATDIEKMKSLINNRDLYKKYFIESPYIKTQSEHFYAGYPYPVAVYVDCFKFPQGYVKDNFLEAFVLSSVLTFFYGEEIEESFWDISKQERKDLMDKDDVLKWYAECCSFVQKNPNVREVTKEEEKKFLSLLDEILKFNNAGSEFSNKIKGKLQNKKLIYFKSFGENFPVIIVAISDDEIVFFEMDFCD